MSQANIEDTSLPISASDADTAHPQTDQGTVVSRESHSEVGCNTRAGVVPPELEAIGRKNSASLEKLMKRLYGD